MLPILEDCDPEIQIFFRQKSFMKQEKFNWQQEMDLMNVNLPKLTSFIQQFYHTFNWEIDKQFGTGVLF